MYSKKTEARVKTLEHKKQKAQYPIDDPLGYIVGIRTTLFLREDLDLERTTEWLNTATAKLKAVGIFDDLSANAYMDKIDSFLTFWCKEKSELDKAYFEALEDLETKLKLHIAENKK